MSLVAVGMRRAILSALSVVGVLALTAGCTSSSHQAGTAGGSTADSAAPSGSVSIAASGSPVASNPSTAASSGVASSTATKPVKPVPAPSSGNIHETVPSRAVTTEPPVNIGRPATIETNMRVTVTAVKAITGKAHGPGEISGPAVEIVVKFDNASSHHVDFGKTVVNVTVAGSNGDQGLSLSGPPARVFSGTLAARSSTVGRYVFTLPKSQRSPIKITISDSATTSQVLIVDHVN